MITEHSIITSTTKASTTDLPVATVAWEPCSEFHDDPEAADGRCAGCGWAPEEHESALPTAA